MSDLFYMEKQKHIMDHPNGIIHPNCHFCLMRMTDQLMELESTNAKLLELCKEMIDYLDDEVSGPCDWPHCKHCKLVQKAKNLLGENK